MKCYLAYTTTSSKNELGKMGGSGFSVGRVNLERTSTHFHGGGSELPMHSVPRPPAKDQKKIRNKKANVYGRLRRKRRNGKVNYLEKKTQSNKQDPSTKNNEHNPSNLRTQLEEGKLSR